MFENLQEHLIIHFVAWILSVIAVYLFPKQQILDSSKLKELADENFKLDDSTFSKRVENTVRKGEIARYEQFLLILQCLQGASISLPLITRVLLVFSHSLS